MIRDKLNVGVGVPKVWRLFRSTAIFRRLVLITFLMLVAGCGGKRLAPTPNLYWATGDHRFDEVPEPWRHADTTILYGTDRVGMPDEQIGIGYGHRRSHSLAVGETTVRFGEDLAWEDLVEASITKQRSNEIDMDLVHVEELVRLPASNTPSELTDDGRFVEQAESTPFACAGVDGIPTK